MHIHRQGRGLAPLATYLPFGFAGGLLPGLATTMLDLGPTLNGKSIYTTQTPARLDTIKVKADLPIITHFFLFFFFKRKAISNFLNSFPLKSSLSPSTRMGYRKLRKIFF